MVSPQEKSDLELTFSLFGHKVHWAIGKWSNDIWASIHNPVIMVDVQNKVINSGLIILH